MKIDGMAKFRDRQTLTIKYDRTPFSNEKYIWASAEHLSLKWLFQVTFLTQRDRMLHSCRIGDFVLVSGVRKNCITNFDNHFGVFLTFPKSSGDRLASSHITNHSFECNILAQRVA